MTSSADQPAPRRETAATAGGPPDLGVDAPPERIGAYRPLETIGTGGMGVVYLAEQTVPVRRRVAIKLIKLGMDTREIVARFEAERQILALLDHPNIARVLEAGATPEGRPYFVMEYVPGEAITRYCDEARLALAARLELFLTVCEAVQHAHQKGIIHRDIKPSNILVEVVGQRAIPKIIDFGVAKATQQRVTDRTLHTERGFLLGTPEYMSPEQASLSALEVDTRTDIYALGVLLYELLSGSLPFDSKTLRAGGVHEIQRLLREVDPPRPSLRLATVAGESGTKIAAQRRTTFGGLVHTVRGDLDWIVMKAIEKERTRRYPSASELAEDVRRFLRHEPVVARPPTPWYRLSKLVRRNRTAAIGAAAALALLVAGAVTTAWQAVRARRAEAEARAQTALAEAVNAFLRNMLAQANPVNAPEGGSLTVREVLDHAARGIDSSLAGQPLVEAEIRATIGDAYRDLHRFEEAEVQLSRAIAILRRESPGSTRLAEALRIQSGVLRGLGRLDDAEHAAAEAVAIHRAALGARDPETALSQRELAANLFFRGDLARSEAILREAAEAAREFAPRAPSHAASVFTTLALVHYERRQMAEAKALYEQAIALWSRASGERHPFVADAWGKLALVHQAEGRLEDARRGILHALEIEREAYGAEHPRTLDDLANLAAVEISLGLIAEADAHLSEAQAIARRSTLGNEQNLAQVLDTLAQVRAIQGRRDEALALYQEALEILRRLHGPDHERLTSTENNLAALLRETGAYPEAERLFRSVLARFRSALGEDHVNVAIALHNLGRTLADQRKVAEAEPLLRDAVARAERLFAPQSVNPTVFRATLGLCLARAGRQAEAEPMLLEAQARVEAQLGATHQRSTQIAGFLEELYASWGRPDDAARWRERAQARSGS